MPLRERNRRSTQAAITEHATRLVLDRGYDNVTVDDICHAVGIAKRTFFNYVDSKETAVLGAPPRVLTEVEKEEFAHRRHGNLLESVMHLSAVTAGWFNVCPAAEDHGDEETTAALIKRRKLILAQTSSVAGHRLEAQRESFISLIDATEAYLLNYPDAQVLNDDPRAEAGAIVTAATGAVKLGTHRWTLGDDASFTALVAAWHKALSDIRILAGTIGAT